MYFALIAAGSHWCIQRAAGQPKSIRARTSQGPGSVWLLFSKVRSFQSVHRKQGIGSHEGAHPRQMGPAQAREHDSFERKAAKSGLAARDRQHISPRTPSTTNVEQRRCQAKAKGGINKIGKAPSCHACEHARNGATHKTKGATKPVRLTRRVKEAPRWGGQRPIFLLGS